MTRLIFYLSSVVFFISIYECKSQEILNKSDESINYILANIYWEDIIGKELSTNQVTIIKQADPKNTSEEYYEGTNEVLVTLLISIVNTGEYSTSKLFSIEQLNNPEILEIKEDITKKCIIIDIQFRNQEGRKINKEFKFDSFL